MVPLTLRLRNFMSYGQEGGELDLRPIHVACLSGGNGNGKSTLVDAITWALWGKSRAAREDDLLRQGTNEMEVELEFATGGAVYRVIRKRVQRKSASSAVLEFAVRDGDTYRAITGNTLHDTERAISELLRLSYETFINSSLLLQGKADLFTVKRPMERKEVLAEILGLGRYEALADEARERARDYRAQLERYTLRIEELDRFLAGLPVLEESLAREEAALAALQVERGAAEDLIADLEGRLRTLAGLQESLNRTQERLGEIERDERQTQIAQETAHGRWASAQALLADEPAIRERLAQLQRARQENDRFGTLLQAYSALREEATQIQGRIGQEQERLRSEYARLEREVTVARTAQMALEPKCAELAALRAEMAKLGPAEQVLGELTDRECAIGVEISMLTGTNTALEERMSDLRQKITMLKSSPICPICATELPEHRHKQVLADYITEGKGCKEQVGANAQRIATFAAEQKAMQKNLAAQQREVRRLQNLCKGEGKLEAEAGELERKAAPLTILEEDEARLRNILATEDFAHDERRALATVVQQATALGYDRTAHEAVAERVRTLAPTEAQVATIESAREELQRAALELNAAEIRLKGLADERARLLAEREPLLEATKDLPSIRATRLTRKQELETLRGREGEMQQHLGSLQRQIADGATRTEERAQAMAARAEADRQMWAYQELGVIFGKRGVQAMLIENALPELEQDANELLARMTDNSTQVQFATQRQGRAGNAIETLEIKIADNMGTRTYEMFSGGEAFRINFAIRIALSRLLARRAGADLSFLLIDEGFGTQDAQGRDRLVEAITAISDDFEKILVVTHIDELKELFDVHIEVSKGPSGSQITVSAA